MTLDFKGLEIDVEVEGKYTSATPDTRSWECPMGYPGDPAEFEVTAVWLSSGKERVDILKFLSVDQVAEIEENLIDEAKEIYSESGGQDA
jgi:hypothetical protein